MQDPPNEERPWWFTNLDSSFSVRPLSLSGVLSYGPRRQILGFSPGVILRRFRKSCVLCCPLHIIHRRLSFSRYLWRTNMQCTNGLGGQSLSTGRNDVGAPSRRGFRPPTRNTQLVTLPPLHPTQAKKYLLVHSVIHSKPNLYQGLTVSHLTPAHPSLWSPQVGSQSFRARPSYLSATYPCIK